MSNHKRRVADPKLVAKRLPQIINAAIQQFGQNGFHSTTIQDIARTAGISIGMIYQYVGDKEELLYLSVFEVVEQIVGEIQRSLTDVTDPLDRYVACVEALTTVIDERRAEAVLGYRESHSMSRQHLEYIKKREREIGQILTDCIEECIEAGVFRKINVEMLMYQSIVFGHNWALNAWRFKHVMTVDKYLKEGIELLIGPVLVDSEGQTTPRVRIRGTSQRKARAERSPPVNRNKKRAVTTTD